MTVGPGSEKPERKLFGFPLWGWLAAAFAVALIYGFVFYSNSAKLARHSEGSILNSASASAAPANQAP